MTVIAERFVVVARLADRGLGENYQCSDPRRGAGAPVQVKLLRPTGAALPPALDALLQHSKLLRDPSILRVLDYGVGNDRPFVVYEPFDGDSLGAVLDRARQERAVVPLEVLREVFDGVASALEFAHDKAPKRVLHLGIDPSCVLVRRTSDKPPRVKVLDFGLLAWADPDPEAPMRSARALRCAPPEVYERGQGTGPQSDVFSLGALLREMLALPPEEGHTLSIAGAARRRTDISDAVYAVIARATMLDPSLRHESIAAFAAAVREAWSQPIPVRVSFAEPVEEPRPAPPALDAEPQPIAPEVHGLVPVLGRMPDLPPPPEEDPTPAGEQARPARRSVDDTVAFANTHGQSPFAGGGAPVSPHTRSSIENTFVVGNGGDLETTLVDGSPSDWIKPPAASHDLDDTFKPKGGPGAWSSAPPPARPVEPARYDAVPEIDQTVAVYPPISPPPLVQPPHYDVPRAPASNAVPSVRPRTNASGGSWLRDAPWWWWGAVGLFIAAAVCVVLLIATWR
jgi:serine/threonine protein kinase